MRASAVILLIACAREPTPVRVAAASDLTDVFQELGRESKVEFTFGASGLLARQVSEGAPFDVFAAANVAFVDQAIASGNCDASTKRTYARGRLAVYTRDGGAALESLGDERFKHIAIANPEHAPYGKAAKEALQSAGLWGKVEPRIVYADNVRAALQLAESGNAEAALVSASLVKSPKLVDESKHEPLIQALVVCTKGKNQAGGRAFAELVTSEAGRAVFTQHGFSPP